MKRDRNRNRDYLSEDDILGTTIDEWNQFRVSFVTDTVPPIVSSPVTPQGPATINSSDMAVRDELTRFRNSIKRDMTEYNEIKDDRDFDNWQRSFLAMAACHQIKEVFDPDYTPNSSDEVEIFNLKQTFAYSVLVRVLKTDVGKTIVRKYEKTMNAQQIWKEFVMDAKFSVKAKISAAQILSWITTVKYDDDWKGTSHGFLLYWINKVRDYETFTDTFSDCQKVTMLQNTVSDIPDLARVHIYEDMEDGKSRNSLTYDRFTSLLLSAAYSYDHSNDLRKGYDDYNVDTHLGVISYNWP
jgi:hypothetical protein